MLKNRFKTRRLRMSRHPIKDLDRLLADHLFDRLNETHLSLYSRSLYLSALFLVGG